MIGTGFRGFEARGFVPVANGIRVGLKGVDRGRGGVILLELADVENVMHVCAAGGLMKVQLKGIVLVSQEEQRNNKIVHCLFEDHNVASQQG